MKNSEIIRFKDLDSDDEAFALVRYDDAAVGLTLSLKPNGDIAVFMNKSDARRLLAALKQAVE
jgi:hypothetical protein